MIQSAIASGVPAAVPAPLHARGGLAVGLPYLTTDGVALITADNHLLLANATTALSASQPPRPYVTSDGYGLLTADFSLLLGA